MDSKLVSVVVIAVLVLAGAGGAIYLKGNGNGNNNGTNGGSEGGSVDDRVYGTMTLLDSHIETVLGVYGNANGDAVLDVNDKIALQEAIAAGKTSELCKYADADHNGTIDDADVAKIQEILDADLDHPVDVWHVQRYRTGDYESVSSYPISKILTAGTGNMLQAFKNIRVCEQIVGVTYSSLVDFNLFPEYEFLYGDKDTYQIGTSAGYVNGERLDERKSTTGVHTLIFADDTSYLKKNEPKTLDEDAVELKGIDVIRIAPATSNYSVLLSDLALVSFFLQIDVNLGGLEGWYTSIVTYINNTLTENVGEGKPYHVVSFANASYSAFLKSSDGTITVSDGISNATSDYTAFGRAAGGYYALTGAASVSNQGNGGAWLSEYTIDKIIVTATASTSFSWYGGTASSTSLVKERIMAYYNSEPYYNGEVYVMSGDMPSIMRIVYAAHIYYPELFTKAWADSVNMQFCTQYLGLSAGDVSNGEFYFSMSDLGIDPHAEV